MRPFVFSSNALPSKKAKSLQKAFPFLKLSVAQEATARALGYPSWFDCITNGTKGELSLPDQEAGMDVRVLRYNHQAGELMKIGLSPFNADHWVRAWGLTGAPTLHRDEAIPLYYIWQKGLIQLERGEISEEEFLERWGDMDDGYSKYPDIDRPIRVCDGVIIGPYGRYPHFVVDPKLEATMPGYLRGNGGCYHIEDGVKTLEMSIPHFGNEYSNNLMSNLSWVQKQWHAGEQGSNVCKAALRKMASQADRAAEEMIVISIRVEPKSIADSSFDKVAVACLKGRDFAEYIRTKGNLNTERVVWFRDVSREDLRGEFSDFDMFIIHDDVDVEDACIPFFRKANSCKPSLPLYSYPFRYGPMNQAEYQANWEWQCLLALDEDYIKDEE